MRFPSISAGFNRVFHGASAKPVMINSVPKAGTHLLVKAVSLLGLPASGVVIKGDTFERAQPSPERCTIPVGVGSPLHVEIGDVRKLLERVERGKYATGHVPYSRHFADMLAYYDFAHLFILRDPRDVVVSHTNFIMRDRHRHFYDYYRGLGRKEQLMVSIEGIKGSPTQRHMLDVGTRYKTILQWLRDSGTCVVTFENLVGTRGGGSHEKQFSELQKLASHTGVRVSRRTMKKIQETLFGDSRTFHRGQIGTWRDAFQLEHVQAFKDCFGDMLVQLGYEDQNEWQ